MAYTLESIREIVSLHKGSKISYRAANGRRKIEERTGIIKETYPSLFTVFIESQQSTISLQEKLNCSWNPVEKISFRSSLTDYAPADEPGRFSIQQEDKSAKHNRLPHQNKPHITNTIPTQ